MHNYAHDRELHESYYSPNENAFAVHTMRQKEKRKTSATWKLFAYASKLFWFFCLSKLIANELKLHTLTLALLRCCLASHSNAYYHPYVRLNITLERSSNFKNERRQKRKRKNEWNSIGSYLCVRCYSVAGQKWKTIAASRNKKNGKNLLQCRWTSFLGFNQTCNLHAPNILTDSPITSCHTCHTCQNNSWLFFLS